MFILRRSLFRGISAIILFVAASTLFSSSARQPEPAQPDPIRALLDLPAPAIFQSIVERINKGAADRFAIGQALLHREKLRAIVGGELHELINQGGQATGVTFTSRTTGIC